MIDAEPDGGTFDLSWVICLCRRSETSSRTGIRVPAPARSKRSVRPARRKRVRADERKLARLVTERSQDRVHEREPVRLQHRRLFDERGRERATPPDARAGARHLRSLVSGQPPPRVRGRAWRIGRHLGALRHERGRQRPTPVDPHGRVVGDACLVGRRQEDRVRDRRLARCCVGDERGWETTAPADA